MRFSWSACEGWGLNVKALRSPVVIRRMKSVSFPDRALQSLRGSGSFSLEHWAKVQKFKKERGHNADSPQTHIIALVVDGAGLMHLHEASFLEQRDGPLTTPLADTSIANYGSHVNVFEAIFQRRRSQAK